MIFPQPHPQAPRLGCGITTLPGRLISRTAPFEGACAGASPAPAANLPLGGEIASRLAYTQKSRGQDLPERPLPLSVKSANLSLKQGELERYHQGLPISFQQRTNTSRAEQSRCRKIFCPTS